MDIELSKEESDFCKGIALIFITLSHLPRVMGGDALNPLGYFGVAVFLFLSGYGLRKSYDKVGLKGFWGKRIKRIIPPLCIITIAISIICYVLKDKRFNPIDIILGCVGLSNVINPVTWYIGLMWYCYLVYWICMKRRIRSELIIGGSILVLSVLFGNTSVNMWGLNAFSFSAGLYGAEKAKKTYNKQRFFEASVLLFIVSFVLYYFVGGNSNWLIIRNPVKSLIALLFLNCFFSFVEFGKKLIAKDLMVKRLGNISYEAFMIHAVFIWYFPELFSTFSKPIALMFFVAVTLGLSEILHSLMSRL